MADEFFLSRWSRLKTRSKEELPKPDEAAGSTPAAGTAPAVAAPELPAAEKPPLPSVESLTGDSDFTPFMDSGVDPNLRRQALRTLFRDPRFNVMDGLDVYIDDFSKPDPIPADWMGKLSQIARLGDYQEPEPEAGADAAPEAVPLAEEAETLLAESSGEASEPSQDLDSPPPVEGSSPARDAK